MKRDKRNQRNRTHKDPRDAKGNSKYARKVKAGNRMYADKIDAYDSDIERERLEAERYSDL